MLTMGQASAFGGSLRTLISSDSLTTFSFLSPRGWWCLLTPVPWSPPVPPPGRYKIDRHRQVCQLQLQPLNRELHLTYPHLIKVFISDLIPCREHILLRGQKGCMRQHECWIAAGDGRNSKAWWVFAKWNMEQGALKETGSIWWFYTRRNRH